MAPTPPRSKSASYIQLIQQLAPRFNVDPRAALAVASMEGLGGGVGDGGHAFGPFQLNDAGGVLTGRPGNHQAFAESPAGIAWALAQISKVAGGLHGPQAVQNIVRRFERPARPDAEVAGALRALGQPVPAAPAGGRTAGPLPPAPIPAPAASAAPGQGDALRKQIALQLIQQLGAQQQQPDFSSLIGLVSKLRNQPGPVIPNIVQAAQAPGGMRL